MAHYYLTDEINALIESGMTVETIARRINNQVDNLYGDWFVSNRRSCDRVETLYAELQAATPAAAANPAPVLPATAKQVDYAWTLIVRATRTGADLPYEKSGLRALSRTTISALIDTLKEQY